MKRNSTPRPRPRTGFLYVAVLFTSLMLVAMVATGLSIATSEARLDAETIQRSAAMRAAESEIFRFAAVMRGAPVWRTENENAVFSPWRDMTGESLVGGTLVRHRLTDEDGSLDDNPRDSVTLTIQAMSGESQYTVSVDLEIDPEPGDFLRHSITTVEDLQIQTGSVSTERSVQINGDFNPVSSSGVLTTPIAQIGGSVGASLRGDLRASENIGPTDLAAVYEEFATPMDISLIPSTGLRLEIENRLIAPESSPFAVPNDQGVYSLDAEGQIVRIRNCRVVGTLVITNAAEIVISGAIHWESASPADAILVSDSPVRVFNLEPVLSEPSLGVNFNPPLTPYQSAGSNNDQNDTYPTSFRGLIQTLVDIELNGIATPFDLTGSVYCFELRTRGKVAIRQLDRWLQETPPGLTGGSLMRLVHGSWRRIESP